MPIWFPIDELAGNAVDQAKKRFDALTESASSMLTEPVLLGHARREFDRNVNPIMDGIKQIGANVDDTISSARQRFDEATKSFDPTLGLGNMRAGFDADRSSNPLGNMRVGTDKPYEPLVDSSKPAFEQGQQLFGRMAQDARSSGFSQTPVIGGAATGALQGASDTLGGLAGSAQSIRDGNLPMGIAGAANSALNAMPDIARGASTEAQVPDRVIPGIDPSTPVLGGLNSPREWAPIAAGILQAPTALERAGGAIAGRVVKPLAGAAGRFGGAAGRALERTPDIAGSPIGAVAGGITGATGGPEDQTWQDRVKRGAIGAAVGAVAGPGLMRNAKNLVDWNGSLNRLQRLGIAAGEDAGHFLDDDIVGEIGRLQAMTTRRLERHQSITDQIGKLEEEMSLRSETLNGPKIERPPSKGMWAGTGRLSESDFVEIAERSELSPYTPQWYDAVDPATIRDYKANAASRTGPKPLTPRQQMTELRNQHRELVRQQKMLEGALTEDMNRTATLEERAAKAGVSIPEQLADDAANGVTPPAPETPAPVRPPRPEIRPDDPGATELARAEADEALAIRHDPDLTGAEKQKRIKAIYDRRPGRTPEENGFLREQATGRVRNALPKTDADVAASLPPELEARIPSVQETGDRLNDLLRQNREADNGILAPGTGDPLDGPPLSGYGAEQQQPVPGMGVPPRAPVSNPQATISPWAANTETPAGPHVQQVIPGSPPTGPAPIPPMSQWAANTSLPPGRAGAASQPSVLTQGQMLAAGNTIPPGGVGPSTQAPLRPGSVSQPNLLSQQQLLAAGNTTPPGGIANTPPPPTTPHTTSPLPAAVNAAPGGPAQGLVTPPNAAQVVNAPLVQPGSPGHAAQVKQFKAFAAEAEKVANKYRYGVNLLSGTAGATTDVLSNAINIPRLYARTAIGAGVEGAGQKLGLIEQHERATTMSQIKGMNKGFATGGMQALKQAWDVILNGTPQAVASDLTGSLVRGKKGIPLELGYRIRLAADAMTTTLGEAMASHSLAFREADRAGLKAGSPEYFKYAEDTARELQKRMADATQTARATAKATGRRAEVAQGGVAQSFKQANLQGDKANYDDLVKEAFGMSRRMAFQQDVGTLGKAAQATREGGSPLGWIIPFFRTTQTIAAEGVTGHPVTGPIGTAIDLGRSVLGSGPYLADAAATGKNAGSVLTRSNTSAVLPASQRIADATIGSMIAMAGAYMVANGMMTDTGPADAALKRRMMDEGWRPLAIKTSNGYIPIARLIGPLAFPLAFGVSAQELASKGQNISVDDMKKFADAQIGQYGQSSGLQDFYNVLNIAFTPDPEERWRAVDRVASGVLGQWLTPGAGMARTITQITDKNIADPRGIPQRLMSVYPQAVREAMGVNIPARTNEIGDPLQRGPGESGVRALLPLQETRANPGLRQYFGSESAESDAEIKASINAVNNYQRHPDQYRPPTDREWGMFNAYGQMEDKVATSLRAEERKRRRQRTASEYWGTGGGGMPSFSAPTVP